MKFRKANGSNILDRIDGYWERLFKIIIALQILLIVCVNLTQLKYHIGYDASAYYLQAMEIWNQKTLLIENFVYQTTLAWDSPVPLAAIFYGITGDIFLGYGIANIICISICVCIFNSILKHLNVSKLSKMIAISLMLTPYVTVAFNNANNIGYFSVMFVSMGAYSIKIAIALLIVKIILNFEDSISQNRLIIIGIAAMLLTALSSGFYILGVVILPIILYYIFKTLEKNDIKVLISRPMLFLMVCIVGSVMFSQLTKQILGADTKALNMVLTGRLDFWKNIGSILLGYFGLLSAMPDGSVVQAISANGIGYISNLFIALLAIGCLIFCVKKNLIIGRFRIIASVILGNIMLFILTYTTYGSLIFEERYLIQTFLMMLILLAYAIDNVNEKLLLRKVGLIALGGCIIISNVISWDTYINTKNEYNLMDEVIHIAQTSNSGLVYGLGSSGILIRNMRVYDENRIYGLISNDGSTAHGWGDYNYYFDAGGYSGSNLLIASEEEYNALPEYTKNTYKYIDDVGGYKIYNSENNKIDLTSGISNGEKSIDYVYSKGFSVNNGEFDPEGNFISNGKSGYAVFGPYTNTKIGTYNFTLHYEVIESKDDKNVGKFDVVTNAGEKGYGEAIIDSNKATITIGNVTFENNDELLEYRVYINEGSKVKVSKIEIEKVEE